MGQDERRGLTRPTASVPLLKPRHPLFGALLKPQRVNRPVLFRPLKQTRWGLGRWVKFEEKVEEGGERWSKPHVSTLTLHSLFELRTCLQTGSILLDLEGYSLPQIVGESCPGQMGHPDLVCDIPVNICISSIFFSCFPKSHFSHYLWQQQRVLAIWKDFRSWVNRSGAAPSYPAVYHIYHILPVPLRLCNRHVTTNL